MSWFSDIGDNRRTMAQLREQLQSHLGVVPFIGAGLCVPCGLPDWSTLLGRLAADCGTTDQTQLLIQDSKFEEAASALEKALGPVAFEEHLRTQLSGPAVKQLAGPVLHVPALTRGPVVTTNLDDVLEQVFERSGHPFERIGLGPQVEAVRGALHQNHPYLIKIHGGLSESDTRVLTLKDYERTYGAPDAELALRERPLPLLLEQIFTSRTLLFIGCSLTLDRTLTYLKRVKRDHGAPALHFAILSDPGYETARRARAEFLSQVNIRPLWYPMHRYDLIEALLMEALQPAFMPPSRSKPKRPASELGPSIGIDLGTSLSAVAYAPADAAVQYCAISQTEDSKLIPTILRFPSEHQYSIGAEDTAVDRPPLAVIQHFKRYLGSNRRYRIGRRDYSAADLATLFLKGLRLAIEGQFDGPLPPALVSMPANFSSRQQQELTDAVKRAGFAVARVIAEPCAASFNLRDVLPGSDAAFLIVDIGGGTTDISIVERTWNESEHDFVFEVGCVFGDNHLGGIDFDLAICDLIRAKFSAAIDGCTPSLVQRHRALIESQGPVVKMRLNDEENVSILFADIETVPGKLATVRIEIGRQEFLSACRDLLARIESLVDRALQAYRNNGFNPSLIAALMLAGQGSRLAPIRRLLESKLALPMIDQFEDIAVARGLARQSHNIGSGRDRWLIRDVMNQSIYLAWVDGMRAWREPERGLLSPRLAGKEGRQLEPVTDGTGRQFLPLLADHRPLLDELTIRLEFDVPLSQLELATFETGCEPASRFQFRRKWLVRFSEPVWQLRLTVTCDEDRNVLTEFTPTDAYVVSLGPTEASQVRPAKRHVKVPV